MPGNQRSRSRSASLPRDRKGRWRKPTRCPAGRGRRDLYLELCMALCALKPPVLIRGTDELDGAYSALGALFRYRGLLVPSDPFLTLGEKAKALAIEGCEAVLIRQMNDLQVRQPESPEQRWCRMVLWAAGEGVPLGVRSSWPEMGRR